MCGAGGNRGKVLWLEPPLVHRLGDFRCPKTEGLLIGLANKRIGWLSSQSSPPFQCPACRAGGSARDTILAISHQGPHTVGTHLGPGSLLAGLMG